MAGFACGVDAPCDGAAAADAAVEDAVHARGAFKFERDVAVFCGGDHVAAGDGGRLAVGFFIAAEHDSDFSLLENAGSLHGFQREEHVDKSALHIVDARAGGDVAIDAVGLEGAGLFKDGVHVANEQDAFAAFLWFGAGMLGDKDAGALHLVHRNPLHLEVEIAELRLHDFGDGVYAFKVVGAAVDVDEFCEHVVRSLLVGVDVGDDGFLFRGKRRRILRKRGNAERSSE